MSMQLFNVRDEEAMSYPTSWMYAMLESRCSYRSFWYWKFNSWVNIYVQHNRLYLVSMASISMLRDQLNHLRCRYNALLTATIDRTYSHLIHNLLDLWSWHSVAKANILEHILDAISRDGGLSVELTGGGCGLDDVLSESAGEFHRVADERGSNDQVRTDKGTIGSCMMV